MTGAEQGKVEVTLLTPDQWERLREIRLSALKLNPEAFGAKYEDELLLSEQQWRDRFVKEDYLVASINGKDAGTLYIEVLNGDHGATCWCASLPCTNPLVHRVPQRPLAAGPAAPCCALP